MAAMAMNNETMMIRISAFAAAGQIVGTGSTDIHIPTGSTIDQAWRFMIDRHESLERLDSTIAFGLNDRLNGRNTVLEDGDRLDLLPPVSGG